MDIITASTENALPSPELESVNEGRAGLSALQREFCTHFVLTGGKPRRAAILAGYSVNSASISAHRNLVNRRVLAEIKKLATCNAEAALPVAIRTFLDVCMNSKDDRARVSAAAKLVELGGMMPKGNGVQVNVGIQVNGQQVQTLIESIWDRRNQRMSDIEDGMSDNTDDIEVEALPAPEQPIGEGVGGVRLQGPIPGPVPVPPPSDEHSGK